MAVDLSQVAHVETEPGELPPTMAAWVIREERQGEPVGCAALLNRMAAMDSTIEFPTK